MIVEDEGDIAAFADFTGEAPSPIAPQPAAAAAAAAAAPPPHPGRAMCTSAVIHDIYVIHGKSFSVQDPHSQAVHCSLLGRECNDKCCQRP